MNGSDKVVWNTFIRVRPNLILITLSVFLDVEFSASHLSKLEVILIDMGHSKDVSLNLDYDLANILTI